MAVGVSVFRFESKEICGKFPQERRAPVLNMSERTPTPPTPPTSPRLSVLSEGLAAPRSAHHVEAGEEVWLVLEAGGPKHVRDRVQSESLLVGWQGIAGILRRRGN